MSLYRQLWIAIGALMLVVFGTTFLINGFSSSRYLEKQLTIKNSDDASALALSLSQQSLDPVALEIQLASQLDLGSYERVEFQNADGSLLFNRSKAFESNSAPRWLKLLFPIDASPGSATVNSGWTQLGTLSLKSHDDFAYAELWASAQRSLLALVLATIAAGLLSSLLLRLILKPLDQVVAQATALGERRFTALPEPGAREFARVTRAMNTLTLRVQTMLAEDAERLVERRQSAAVDELTGLQQREPFLDSLSARLESETWDSDGSLALLRINRLAELNQMYGRKTMDALLRDMGSNLSALGNTNTELSIAHTNASDFIILAPREDNPEQLGALLLQTIRPALSRHDMLEDIDLPAACTGFQPGDTVSQLMSELDEALMLSANTAGTPLTLALEGSKRLSNLREKTREWEYSIKHALAEQALEVTLFPVLNSHAVLMHSEALLQLRVGDDWVPASTFMPWAHRVAVNGLIDRAIVKLGLERASAAEGPLCISLSSAALSDTDFVPWLNTLFATHAAAASKLLLSVSESTAFTDPKGFSRLQSCLSTFQAQLGIQQMGHRVSDVGLLGELGADYLKIDRLFIHGINESEGKRALVQIYVNIARALGVPCFADGVRNQAERDTALLCGASGVAGPAVSLP